MNIFAVSPSFKLCAEFLDNKRLNKMTIETAQIFSTGFADYSKRTKTYNSNLYRTNPEEKDKLMRPTHTHHPVMIWAGSCKNNLLATAGLFKAYLKEYEKRFDKSHGCEKVFPTINNITGFVLDTACLPDEFINPPPNCARNKKLKLDYSYVKDVYSAYRYYLQARWILEVKAGRPPKFTTYTEKEKFWLIYSTFSDCFQPDNSE